eukprot:TRINITY_DN797_c0_g2_i1.p1 TRINITY_DN797_c0_g2~~TRINITY_DN797_c0_g2_i1.p1  ORF type:complete len:233 (+),score=143.65 TRINITY_DN797_c0_g2_i1:45-743(+)
MSFLKKMFGGGGGGGDTGTSVPKPRTPPSEPHVSAEERMSRQIQNLEKREQVLEVKMKDELKKAAEWNAKKNKSRALQCLKKKKMYEQEIEKIQAQCMNLMTLQMAQENSARQNDILAVQQEQVKKLKQTQMSAEQVENLKEDLEDAMANQQEIDQLLAEPLAGGTDMLDEDDLLAELEDFEKEQEDDALAAALGGDAMPAVPSKPMPEVPAAAAQEEEDAMLAEMEAEMMA